MNNLQIFQNESFGEIRTLEEDGKILFCATDIATALEYTNPYKAIRDHCRDLTKRSVIDSLGRTQEANFIPEGDVYRLIIKAADQSKSKNVKDKAEKFERWLFDDVLPSIRKTGVYIHPNVAEKFDLNKREYLDLTKTVAKCSQFNLPYVLDLARPYLSEESIQQYEEARRKQIAEAKTANSVGEFLKLPEYKDINLMNVPVRFFYGFYEAYCSENEISPLKMGEFGEQVGEAKKLVTMGRWSEGDSRKYTCFFTTAAERDKYREQRMLEIVGRQRF